MGGSLKQIVQLPTDWERDVASDIQRLEGEGTEDAQTRAAALRAALVSTATVSMEALDELLNAYRQQPRRPGPSGGPRPEVSNAEVLAATQVGLRRAAQRFKPSKGVAFSTYADWWVRAEVVRTLDG